ncbi:MAG: hypothetical protein MZV70_45275 [Desulfobacterales bacterium]|nr:hypothetical protein [Desulfobacterales bacterium]
MQSHEVTMTSRYLLIFMTLALTLEILDMIFRGYTQAQVLGHPARSHPRDATSSRYSSCSTASATCSRLPADGPAGADGAAAPPSPPCWSCSACS